MVILLIHFVVFTLLVCCWFVFFSLFWILYCFLLHLVYIHHVYKIQCLFFQVLKCTQKNRRFRVFLMFKIGQTHVFVKDYVHIHQMGSHFVGGYRLDFSPTEQETKTSILQAFSTR